MQSIMPYAADVLSLAARAVITLFLVFAILLLSREIWRMWTRPPLTLGEVRYFEDGTAKTDRSQGIAAELIDRRNALKSTVAQLISASKRQRAPVKPDEARIEVKYDQIFTEGELNDLQSAADAIPEIELKIQGNDIGSIITGLRRWVVPRNVVRLSAFKRTEGIEFSIDWPASLALHNSPYYERALRDSVASAPNLGKTVGCRVLWLELARSAQQVASTHPDVFCRWAQARRVFDFAEAELSATGKSDGSKPQIKMTVDALKEIAERVGGFPPLQNIYALLLERGAPDEKRRIAHAWENLRRVNLSEKPIPYEPSETFITERLASAPDAQLVPGKSLQIGASGGVVHIRLTAIVQDKANTRYLVLPDYAFPPGGSEQVFVPVTVNGKEELLLLGGRSNRQIAYPIVLVELAKDIKVANVAQGIKIEHTSHADLDMTLRLVGDDELYQAQVVGVDVKSTIATVDEASGVPGLIVTNRFTAGRGNGGAPVLAPNNALVGMLYAGSTTTNLVLPLADIFDGLSLSLIR